MAFTDRFIRLPVKVYDRKQAELTGKSDYEDSWIKINPFEISEYKPTEDTDNDNTPCTYIVMKGGSGFFCYMIIDEFEKHLNDSQK